MHSITEVQNLGIDSFENTLPLFSQKSYLAFGLKGLITSSLHSKNGPSSKSIQ